MKLLHVVAGMDPSAGGVTEAVRSMVNGICVLGVENEIVCMDSPDAPYFTNNALKIHAMGPSKTAWRYTPHLLPWLKEHLDKYDVVIIHGLWQYHVYAVTKALKSMKNAGPKLLVMPHGMLDPYFQKAKGRRLKAIRNLLFWKFTEQHAINMADGILFTCETEKVLAGESFKPYQPKREDVVGLGIDEPPLYVPAMKEAFLLKCNGADPEGCLLYISRIHPKKGTDLLITAYKAIRKGHPSLPKLVIAGPGLDSDYGIAVRAAAEQDKDIIFTGMLEGNARWGAFYGCSAMILPSHQENFGFVVVEAMACGKPVLISNQVNIWREIEKEGAGIIKEDTEAGIKALLAEWLGLPVERKEMIRSKAKPAFEKNFSLQSASARLKKTVDTILG